jgi:hypothetical protein
MSRRLGLSVCLVCLAPSLASAAAAPTTLLRWGFEHGTAGWRKWSGVEMRQWAGPPAHSGRRALWGEIRQDNAVVLGRWDLDFPVAGARLSFWYYVPRDATFGWLGVNARTREFGDRMFQLTRGLRKGAWTRAEISFAELFGACFGRLGTLRISEFEIACVGVGRLGLDDVEVTVEDDAAARIARVPCVIYPAGLDATAAPGGARAYFRRRFSIGQPPRRAWLQAGGDEAATVWFNGKLLGEAGLSPATEYDIRPLLRSGGNVVAAAVVNHGDRPNPTGFVAALGTGDRLPDETVVVSDRGWLASAEAPEGWVEPGFDDSGWRPAQEVRRLPGPPWGNWMIVDIYPLKRPADRLAPAMGAEVRDGRIVAVLTGTAETPAEVSYDATVSALASDLSRRTVASRKGRARLDGGPAVLDLAAAAGLTGAVEVEVRTPGAPEPARKVLWLAGRGPEQVRRRAAATVPGAGFIRAVEVGGRWFLADAEGRLFHSLACNAVTDAAQLSLDYHHHVAAHYADRGAWAEFTTQRLFDLGFNSLSGGEGVLEAHRERNMPYFAGMNLTWAGPRLQDAAGNRAFFPDVFDPAWRKGAEEWVRGETGKYRDDPLLLGYFTDNEIQMHEPLSPSQGVMGYFWSPSTTRELIRWLGERYGGDVVALNRRWSSPLHTYAYTSFEEISSDKPTIRGPDDPVAADLRDFVRHIIKTYVDTVVGLYRKHDPNHLVCSNRFAGVFDVRFADLLKPYDIIACNSYPRSRWGQTDFDEGQLKWLRAMHEASGRPVLISEWSVSANDTRLANFWGRLDTQSQRGQAYRRVLRQLWDEGYIVGVHWFCWADLADSEAVNEGIVGTSGRFYEPLATAMRETNREYTARLQAWTPAGAR